MAHVNLNFLKLPGGYLFPEISRRVKLCTREQPSIPLIRLGIGDVTQPLAPAVVAAMRCAAEELGHSRTFRGYCEEPGGYLFLRRAIREDYRTLGVELSEEEIFVSDGAKTDSSSIGEIFAPESVTAVCDPVYPVYADSSAMAGRAGDFDGQRWTRLLYLPCTAENGFFPALPAGPAPDLIYLCSPNNPTGTAATTAQLKVWVDYANVHGSVILFDAAYEAFIRSADVPRSIYQIPGAEACSIEFRSFSKTAGFTGVRCAYAVVPMALERDGALLNSLWRRRQSTRFNGVSYITQRGAEAALTPEGRRQIRQAIEYYQKNAKIIREGLSASGLTVYGGVDAPYLWVQTPGAMPSWDFFDLLLRRAGVVSTPGAGFGPNGEGYIRLTAFGSAKDTLAAVERIQKVLSS